MLAITNCFKIKSMSEELKAGDLVKLKTGRGYPMVIESMNGSGNANCCFFNEHTHTMEKIVFALSALTKA